MIVCREDSFSRLGQSPVGIDRGPKFQAGRCPNFALNKTLIRGALGLGFGDLQPAAVKDDEKGAILSLASVPPSSHAPPPLIEVLDGDGPAAATG